MPDNLSFSITAEGQQASDQLELINSKIRSLRKEVKSLADEANRDPLALPKFKAANAELTKLNQTAATLNKTVRGTKQEVEGFGEGLLHLAHGNRSVARLAREFGNLQGSVENTAIILGRFGGGFAGGLVALAAFKGFELLKDTLVEANKALTELKKTGGEIGIRPVALQATREIAREAGQDADEATDILKNLGKIIEDNRRKFNAPVGGGAGLPTVLSGGTLGTPTPGRIGMASGTVNVGRGGVPGLTDPTKALADFDPRLFSATEKGMEEAIIALEKRILELSKTMNETDFNVFAKSIGSSGEALRKFAEEDIPKHIKRVEELNKSGRGATKEHLNSVDQLAAAQGKLATARGEALAPGVEAFRQADIAITNALTQFFETPWRAKFSELWAGVLQDWQSFWAGMVDVAKAAFGEIQSIWQSLSDAASSIASKLSSIGSAVSGAVSGAGKAISDAAAQGAAMPFARGGFVRGPGSGTSDSILARLSAGEFVVNAARVRQVGLGFMRQLNGFADGGFVGSSLPRFAAGGLVATAAGGGTPVHLHLGGQSFAMNADNDVAQALVVASRRYQIRSAGVKPSWYGGRPGA